jgi:nucleoside-diphosphate-sugar epimerase
VLHLLSRGQSPLGIRIVDFREPARKDLLTRAKEVDFAQADITKPDSVTAAFQKPWPRSVANLPLTVFHTAAVIRPGDRSPALDSLVSGVNVVGCANTIAAARGAGADVFVATSSGSIAIRPINVWIWPWEKHPRNMVQVYADPDRDQTLRARHLYFGNYALSKAQAEDMVIKANADGFRTGCIRPACGVYANRYDLTVGAYIKAGTLPS